MPLIVFVIVLALVLGGLVWLARWGSYRWVTGRARAESAASLRAFYERKAATEQESQGNQFDAKAPTTNRSRDWGNIAWGIFWAMWVPSIIVMLAMKPGTKRQDRVFGYWLGIALFLGVAVIYGIMSAAGSSSSTAATTAHPIETVGSPSSTAATNVHSIETAPTQATLGGARVLHLGSNVETVPQAVAGARAWVSNANCSHIINGKSAEDIVRAATANGPTTMDTTSPEYAAWYYGRMANHADLVLYVQLYIQACKS